MPAPKRLRPGELDGLVLTYMRKHKGNGPLTATAIGKGISRSAGAVANCLARLAKAKPSTSRRRGLTFANERTRCAWRPMTGSHPSR